MDSNRTRSFGSAMNAVLGAAQVGPVLEAEIVSLTGLGKLRVTYNWLYSALNCDPGDGSTFVWVLSKLDDTHVSLSPRDGYSGMTLYASVRGDLSYRVEVQAPYSADWITAVGGDERIGLEDVGGGLLAIRLRGFNGAYISLDSASTAHDDHTGYLLQSNDSGSLDPHARTWFLGISAVRQAGLGLRLKDQVTQADLEGALAAGGLSLTSAQLSRIQSQIG
jgi:hypothetical protein